MLTRKGNSRQRRGAGTDRQARGGSSQDPPELMRAMRGASGVMAAVIILVAGDGVVACSTAPPRTAAERVVDAETAERVQAALLADPNIYARHIDVEVNRGVVNLGGYVWESDDFNTARRDATSVPGVKTVITQMELMRGGLTGTAR